jgi:hypothetical protein
MDEWAYSDDESPNRNEDKYTEYYKVSYVAANFERNEFDGYFEVNKITDKEEIKKWKEVANKKFNQPA